ncbi:hypothetical protein N8652_00530 [bacterium]|nr:hypothetical protein [bacterium]
MSHFVGTDTTNNDGITVPIGDRGLGNVDGLLLHAYLQNLASPWRDKV